MSKWNGVRDSFERAHRDLFEGARYSGEFFNYSQGTRDPDADEITGQTRSSIGTMQVELVPPSQDSTIDQEGTSFDWATSIRFPEDDALVSSLTPLGEDSERPTEVEITDQVNGETEVFELHSYTTEVGSGLVMCRLQEQ